MAISEDYIELERLFLIIPEDFKAKDDDDTQLRPGFHKTVGWAELLIEHRVVILAEPGAGKTWEIRHKAEQLRQDGKPSFFLRLEHVSKNFDLAFDVGSIEEFKAWQQSDREAWIFLDSVDEARLDDPRDFSLAVRKLAMEMQGTLQRAHVFITSRLHEWRWDSDAALIAEKLPYRIPDQLVSVAPHGGHVGTSSVSSSKSTSEAGVSRETSQLAVSVAPLTQDCQSAPNIDPRSARNFDPTWGWVSRRPRPERRSVAEQAEGLACGRVRSGA